jgi:hypothetical protein
LFGQSVTVRKIRRLGETLQISVNHPDGGSFALPASETNLASQEYPSPFHGKALLALDQLLALTNWIAVHASGSLSGNGPGSPNPGTKFEDGEVAPSNPHVTSPLPTRRSLRRDKRPAATPD